MKLELNVKDVKWYAIILILAVIEITFGLIFDVADSNFDMNILVFSVALSILWLIISGLMLKMNHRLLSKILIANSITFIWFNVFSFSRALESMSNVILGFAFIFSIITLVVILIKNKLESQIITLIVLSVYFLSRILMTLLIWGFYGLAL